MKPADGGVLIAQRSNASIRQRTTFTDEYDLRFDRGSGVEVCFHRPPCRLVTRRIPARIPTFLVALGNAGFVTVGGAGLALVQGIQWPEAWQVGLLALAACFLSSGYLLMVATLRLGELSVTAPFRYSIMVFAILSGILVFDQFPDVLATMGMVLIVGTGLFAARREAKAA